MQKGPPEGNKVAIKVVSDSEDETPPTGCKDVSSVGTPMFANPPTRAAPTFSTKAGAKVEITSTTRDKLSRFAFWPREKSERTVVAAEDRREEQNSAKSIVVSDDEDVVHQEEKKDAEDVSASEDEKFSDQEQEQRLEDEEEEEGEEEEYTSRKQSAILDFVNMCTEEEACSLLGKSSKKAGLLLSLRPLKSWKDLVRDKEGEGELSEYHGVF